MYYGHHLKITVNGHPVSRLRIEGTEPSPKELALIVAKNAVDWHPPGSPMRIRIIDQGGGSRGPTGVRRSAAWEFTVNWYAGQPSVTSKTIRKPGRRKNL